MTDYRDAIAAFVDQEPVSAQDLSAALSAADGREYLIDLLVLRGLVQDVDIAGGFPASLALRRTGQAGSGSAGSDRSRRTLWLGTAAAALVALGLSAGFVAGRTTGARQSAIDLPMQTASMSDSVQPAPAPTHVIRMEKGVDWNERSGGN